MKAIKISDEAYELLQKLAKEEGTSIKELADRSIKAYYQGTIQYAKEITKIEEKTIVLKYPSKCYKCGRQLNEGDIAVWQRFTFSDKSTRSRVLCLECASDEKVRDKTLVKLYLKKKEYERLIKALKKEADELAKKVEELQYVDKAYQLQRKLELLIDNLERLFEDKEEIYRIKEQILDIQQKLNELIDFGKQVILPKYIRKKRYSVNYRR